MCLLLDRILGTGILCVEKVDLPAPIFGLGLLVFGRSVGMNMGQPVLGCGQCIPQYRRGRMRIFFLGIGGVRSGNIVAVVVGGWGVSSSPAPVALRLSGLVVLVLG